MARPPLLAAALLLSLQLPACSPSPPADSATELLSWLAANGATLHPSLAVRVSEATGIRGLHAEAPLAVGTELARVPRSLWLDDSTAATSGVGPLLVEIKAQATRLPQHTSLLIFLLHERLRGEASFWSAYFAFLPQAYPELPASWPDARRTALLSAVPRGLAEWIAHEHWSYSETEFDLLRRIVFEPHPTLFPAKDQAALRAAYEWAYGTIHSRGHSGQEAMSAEVDGEELFAIIPFLDVPNHANSAAGVNGDLAQVPESAAGGEQAAIQLLANRGYTAGEELHVAYDNVTSCHAKFLAMYGFTDPDSARDCFHLSLDPSEILEQPQPIDEDYRYQLLTQQGLISAYDLGGLRRGRPLMWDLHRGEIPTQALAVIRVLSLPPQDALSAEQIETLQDGSDEAKNWQILETVIMQSLAVFGEEKSAPVEDAVLARWSETAGVGMEQVGKALQKRIRQQLRKLKSSSRAKKKKKKATVTKGNAEKPDL